MSKLQKNKILLVSILSILSFSLCACSKSIEVEVPKTIVQIYVPEKVTTPPVPAYYKLNPDEGIDSVNNFTKLQKNLVLQKNYIKLLNNVIAHYEKQIDDLNIIKQQSETEQK